MSDTVEKNESRMFTNFGVEKFLLKKTQISATLPQCPVTLAKQIFIHAAEIS